MLKGNKNFQRKTLGKENETYTTKDILKDLFDVAFNLKLYYLHKDKNYMDYLMLENFAKGRTKVVKMQFCSADSGYNEMFIDHLRTGANAINIFGLLNLKKLGNFKN